MAALEEAPYAFGSTYQHETAFDEAVWRRRVAERVRFVAEVDRQIAGTVSIGPGDRDSIAAVTAMWVDPRFRRSGLGALLLDTVLDWARAQGVREVRLWVTEVNTSAQRLYERNGFVRTGAVQDVRPGEREFEMVTNLR